MQAGVEDEPDRTPQLRAEAAEVLIGIGEEPEVPAERLRVKTPPFDVCGIEVEPLEAGEARLLTLDRDLEVMAGISFVKGERLRSGARALGRPTS
jgi:hypothetical protein